MIKHIVMWNLKEENKEKNALEIKNKLESLKAIIPQIRSIEVGRNFNESDMAYDLVLYTEFETKEDLEIYQNHSAHKAVAKFVAEVRTARAVGDYEVK